MAQPISIRNRIKVGHFSGSIVPLEFKRKNPRMSKSLEVFRKKTGANDETRTRDLLITNQNTTQSQPTPATTITKLVFHMRGTLACLAAVISEQKSAPRRSIFNSSSRIASFCIAPSWPFSPAQDSGALRDAYFWYVRGSDIPPWALCGCLLPTAHNPHPMEDCSISQTLRVSPA